MPTSLSQPDWETLWAPYDQPTYDLVLAQLKSLDTVLDIGAGDLRLTRQMTSRVNHVYAIEIDSGLIVRTRFELPSNLTLLVGDALTMAFPTDITCGILLMRHCAHYRTYTAKLKRAGAARLITNARWRMSIETVDLLRQNQHYGILPFGWYACECGATGFKPGRAEALTSEDIETIHEVCDCPACKRLDYSKLLYNSPSGKDVK
jgi:ribosomal RNA adenine dimethylase